MLLAAGLNNVFVSEQRKREKRLTCRDDLAADAFYRVRTDRLAILLRSCLPEICIRVKVSFMLHGSGVQRRI